MFGAIFGDLSGAPYECGGNGKTKDYEFFLRGAHFTDDTVMTIAVFDGILKSGILEKDDFFVEDDEKVKNALIQSMQFWGKKYPRAGYGGSFIRWLNEVCPEPYNSWGNGSAMRVSSVGWLFDSIEKTRHIARLSAEVSHNHPEGIKGAESVAAAIFLARTKKSKEEIKNYIQKEFGYNLERSLDKIRPDYYFEVSCQGSVPESIIAFLESSSYEDAVRNAVSLCGDTDTMGAIAGSIAEAFYGIPDELCKKGLSYLPSDILDVLTQFEKCRK